MSRMPDAMPAAPAGSDTGAPAVIKALAACALFLVPFFAVTPSPGLMHAMVYGALALGVAALLTSLAADGDRTSLLYGASAFLAMAMAAAGGAAIFEVYSIAAPIADRTAAMLAAALFGLVILTIALWRSQAERAAHWRKQGKVKGMIMLVILAIATFCYGGALAVTVDQAHEIAPPQRFQTELYAQDVRHDWKHGKVFNELYLAPWGPQPARELDVDLPTYDKVSEGLNVCPELHFGLFGIGWFRIMPCPPALLRVAHHIPRDLAAEQRHDDMTVMPWVALGGLLLLALGGAGLATGTVQGRYGSYDRATRPVSFWVNVVILALCGAAALGIAMFILIRDLFAA